MAPWRLADSVVHLVSVIIPTRHRADLVTRAVASALGQTWPALEVIVVIDGPDPATEAALQTVADRRLRVLSHDRPRGPGAARNTGAAAAHGAFVAFLDDDDEWLPTKLGVQLAGMSPREAIVLSCRCHVRTRLRAYVWPRRLPQPGQPVDDYLFARRSLRRGDAYLATPTLVLPKWLFDRTGFGDTWQYEDTTLLLRATRGEQASVRMVPEVLVTVHAQDAGRSLGSHFAWTLGLDWVRSMRPLFTRKGYSGFCLVTLGSQAARMRDWRALPVLLGDAWRHGAPRPTQLLLFAAFWAVPQPLRQRLHSMLERRRR